MSQSPNLQPEPNILIDCQPDENGQWMVVIAAVVPLTVTDARQLSKLLADAASFAEVQSIGEENAEALNPEPSPDNEQQG